MKKIIIGVSGEMASGKETVTKYLEKKYSAEKYRMSDIMRDILFRISKENTRENLVKVSGAMRNIFGQGVFIDALVQDIKNNDSEIIIIDGVRRKAELDELEKNDNFYFLFLKTDLKKRYERMVQRGEKDDDNHKTFEEFKKDHFLETEKTILEIEPRADFILSNDGSLDNLYEKIDSIILELKK